ncbi:ATP-dependent DNA helicase [Candidatus Symbiothrix dinenymphae]|nr:ATP-dependent DNA helicase [Candidatus Symbiothrix dinenymphae]
MYTESQHIEFKPGFNEDVIETLVSFANSKGGRVLVGVANDGAPVKGFTIGQESIQQWLNEIKMKTQPAIVPDADVIEYEGVAVVELKVQEYPIKPVACRGKYYKRVQNSNHMLSISEMVNLHLQTLNTSWDAYPDPDPTHTLDDISWDKVQKAMDMMKLNGITINETALQFLLKYNLIRDDKLTSAAYLMFKKNDGIDSTIELGRFQNFITIKDTARTQSDILSEIDHVIDFVKKHINKEIIITGEPRNTQKWQYPMEAIREIVINMIIHRDYSAMPDSVVKIYNDKIEFYNPGKLPDEITIEDLLSNNYKSTPRNKLIADFFKHLGLIEKYGSGIGRIINYFEAENLPAPEFKNISGGFQVTVFAPAEEEDTKESTDVVENDTKVGEKVADVVENEKSVVEKVGEKVANVVEKEKRVGEKVANVVEKGKRVGEKVTNVVENEKRVGEKVANVVEKEKRVGEKVANVVEKEKRVGEKVANVVENEKRVGEKVTNVVENEKKVGEKVANVVEKDKRVGEKVANVVEKGKRVGEKVGENSTKNQNLILKYIIKNHNISSKELSAIIGISARKIEKNIAKLKAKGVLERIGPDKGGYWKVLSQ